MAATHGAGAGRGARRLGPVRRRLHRRARPPRAVAEPRLLGGPPRRRDLADRQPSATGTDPSTSRRGCGCATRPTRSRCSRRPTGRSPRPIADAARGHVERMAAAIEELKPRFPHDDEYLTAAVEDLRAWDFGKPDFTRALGEFRPELARTDGIEHLVLFPMYKQNGSRDTCFEALIVRVPWPDWIAELERTRYDNPKYVAGRARRRDARATTASARCCSPRPCRSPDRPVEQLRRDLLRPRGRAAAAAGRRGRRPAAAEPPARRGVHAGQPGMSQQAYILWDLIHDRAHSHGDLPFDPFMIRQRAPYWMYSLEELRCDLTAFGQAVELEAEGVAFARVRPVRDPARPAAALPDHRLAGPQLRRPRRAAAVRLPAPSRLPALDRQPADDRVGPGRRGRRGAARTRSRSCTGAGSTAPSSSTGRRRTTWSRRASRRRPARSGARRCASSPTSRIRGRTSTSSATTSSRCRSSIRR